MFKLNSDCRFCSLISQANGEDPIGSAETLHNWFAIEIELPWSEKRLAEKPLLTKAIALMTQKIASGIKIIGQLIARDREYSQPGYTRLFYYRRPSNLFADFEKYEFLVPDADVGNFAIALLETIPHSLDRLKDGQKYRQKSSQIRELMVCTDGSVDLACGKFGSPIYQQLRSQYSREDLRVWRINHIGGHQFAPTLLDWSSGHCWGHLSSEVLDILVSRSGSIRELRPFYRGWSGLTQFEQIVEREIWLQKGWPWFDYLKAGQILAMERINGDWAEVRLDFMSRDGSIKGAYEAKVEATGFVMTASDSGMDRPLRKEKQYQVSSLLEDTSN
jgi:hypothetical protein